MVIIFVVVAIIAIAIFLMVSGENRKRKGQNPIEDASTHLEKKPRGAEPD
jgi:hypothetical protein